MNELVNFKNEDFGEIRTMLVDGVPYFVGRDVALALGYAKPRNAILQHVDNEDALKQGIPDSQGLIQQTTLINESGVYSLILAASWKPPSLLRNGLRQKYYLLLENLEVIL